MNRAGFTLFEVIIVIGIFSGIMLLVTMFALDIADFAVYYQQDLAAKQELQAGIKNMQAEIRSANYSAAGGYPVLSADSSSLVFFSDLDKNGTPEEVRYTFRSSTLEKSIIYATGTPPAYATSSETTSTVVYFIRSGGFEYFSSTFTGTQASLTAPIDMTQIRLVRFSVTVDLSSSTRPVPLSSAFTVDLRNIY